MEKITLSQIEYGLERRGLWMYCTSQVELKNGGVKTIWVVCIRDRRQDIIGPVRRRTIQEAKRAAYEELLRKEG